MKDFIIVGSGLAGICFAETLLLHGKSFVVISDDSQNSSRVAAGLYNPVILKRLNMPSGAKEHMDYIGPFYQKMQQRLGIRFDFEVPVYRKFNSFEEQNDWFQAADKPALAPFLSVEIIRDSYPCLPAPFGFGKVLHTGYVDTAILLDSYREFLINDGNFLSEAFNHDALEVNEEYLSYKGIKARHIVFAEGFGIHANPYFSQLPLGGTKGELLIIRAPELKLDVAVNAGVFILPVGNDIYKVGATYEWEDKTCEPTEAARKELVEKLEGIISCNYEIVGHLAGVRPTVKDRKPLIGTHPLYKRIHLLNGLGTRGVMLGPPMAMKLYNSIESGEPVEQSINLARFMP